MRNRLVARKPQLAEEIISAGRIVAVAKARRDIGVGVGKAGKVRLLRQILDRRARLGEAAAAVSLDQSGGDLQERGFARAVAPDNAKPGALFDEQLRPVQQGRGADGEADVLKRQKRRGHVDPCPNVACQA